MLFFINTLIGYFGALIYDVSKRNKESESSPREFNLMFFLKDNKLRLILSFLLSMIVMLALVLNKNDISSIFGNKLIINNLIYIVVGACPDLIISYGKRKLGLLQPKQVNEFKRKQ